MAKKQTEEVEVASLNPADFLEGGLKTNFRGTIKEAVYCPFDYRGTIDEPILAVRLTIEVTENQDGEAEDKPYVDNWSAGSLDAFVPSEDGKKPATAEDDNGNEVMGEGPYAVKVGKRPGLNNNTKFAHLMQTVIEAGTASKKFGVENLTSSLECLVGLDAHWDRVPQKKRAGMAEGNGKPEGGKKFSNNDVLVVSSVYGYGAASAKKAKTAAPATKTAKKAAPVEDDEDEDAAAEVSPIDDKLNDFILTALAEADDSTIKRGKLAAIVLKAAAKDKDKAKLVKRVGEEDFLSGNEAWVYDEDEGTLTLA